jgi:hypothetical protein
MTVMRLALALLCLDVRRAESRSTRNKAVATSVFDLLC